MLFIPKFKIFKLIKSARCVEQNHELPAENCRFSAKQNKYEEDSPENFSHPLSEKLHLLRFKNINSVRAIENIRRLVLVHSFN